MPTYFIKSLLPWHKIQTKISGGKQLLILLINIDATKHYHTEPETSKKDYVLWPSWIYPRNTVDLYNEN